MADNDTSIVAAIIAIFLIVGTFLPFVHQAFGSSYTDFGVGKLQASLGLIQEEDLTGFTSVFSGFTFLGNIVLMFFWSFSLPWWIEVFFLFMRMILLWLIVRLIRGTG